MNMSNLTLNCSSTAIPFPQLYGADFLSLDAQLVTNYSQYVHTGYYSNHGSLNVTNVSFCNVSIVYTHPGQGDTIHVQVWLPIDSYNERIQAIGGAGWQAGLNFPSLHGMIAAVGEGYASVSTDAGLGSAYSPESWALLSPGNVNLYLLQDLASTSLNDMAYIGKSICNSFYKQPPKYSYFTGCSQGGRQGMMLAQRYPEAFDGIAASAPAINWNSFFLSDLWPLFVMDQLGEYHPSCEFDAITKAAIEACDGNDGIIDGIISDPASCAFDPMSIIGTTINCSNFGSSRQISSAAATIVRETWSGPKRKDNSSLWFGFPKDAVLTGSETQQGIVPTKCVSNGTCTRGSFDLAEDWVKLFIWRDKSATLSNMTIDEFDRISELSSQIYASMIDTSVPDLSRFRDRGGKMISYHGMADNVIPSRGSEHYYDAVMAKDPNVHDYYRLFISPGLSHCFGGPGAYPDTTFDALRKWVETGMAPETLEATSIGTTPVIHRLLCPYPRKGMNRVTTNSVSGDGSYCV